MDGAACFAAPIIHEDYSTYTLDGTTAEQLRQQMAEHGFGDDGQHADAMTRWFISWNYTWQYDNPVKNPCYVTHVAVKANISYSTPEWVNMSGTDSALQARWENYITHLKAHEQGHAENGKRAANEIEQALLNIPPASNCEILRSNLESAARNIMQQHQNWDVQYDAETGHGRTQGAVFP